MALTVMMHKDLFEKTRFNKNSIQQSMESGCCSCILIFPSNNIKEYTEDDSAMCPNYFQVTVIPGGVDGSVEYDYLEYVNEHLNL